MAVKKSKKNLSQILIENFSPEESRLSGEYILTPDPHSLPSSEKLDSTLRSFVGSLSLETDHVQSILLDVLDEPLPETVRVNVNALRFTLTQLAQQISLAETQAKNLVALYRKEANHRSRPVVTPKLKSIKSKKV